MPSAPNPPGAHPAYDPTRSYEVKVFDVEYRRAGDEAWLARVYQPQGTGPFPVLVDLHGGVWSGGGRSSSAARNEALAASGLLIAALDFRLAPRDPYPASVADVNYGTRWLKAHGADFGGDTRHRGGIGASSGGHLVMLSAMRPHDPRYAARPLPGASAGGCQPRLRHRLLADPRPVCALPLRPGVRSRRAGARERGPFRNCRDDAGG
ncbi:MAG TPA: alpha/beta hydrolase [Chloroflexota bacterium]|jgi:acetyl esterase/lipase